MGFICAGAILRNQIAEDSAEHDHGQPLLLEVYPENAPWLVGIERAKLFYIFDLGGMFCIKAEFLRLIIKSDVFSVVGFDGPVEFIAEVGDELRQCFD